MGGPPPDSPLEVLRAENLALKAALQAAREGERRAAQGRETLVKVSQLLDDELFISRLGNRVVTAAHKASDLPSFEEAFFDLLGEVVNFDWVGIRLSRRGYVQVAQRGPQGAGLARLEALAAERFQHDGGAAACTFSFGDGDAFGHLLCLRETPFSDSERGILKTLCLQAGPLFERHLLVGLLQQMATFREDFIYMLSHDLRNPLTGIISALGTLSLPGLAITDAERDGVIAGALESARFVNALIGDLLDVAKYEAGHLVVAKTPVDLSEVAGICCQQLRPLAQARHLVLALDAPEDLPCVLGDERKLVRVLTNLVGNALKYTRRGGVLVRLSAEDRWVVGTVADTGLGVPEAAQALIFEKFYQLPDRSRPGGTGLGLSFCRQMVEAHGGAIWVESPSAIARDTGLFGETDGPGTAFAFRLPLAPLSLDDPAP